MKNKRSGFRMGPIRCTRTAFVTRVVASALVVAVSTGFLGFGRAEAAPSGTPAKAATATGGPGKATIHTPVERGKYLVSILGCNDCHTPWKMGPNGPEPDMSRMLSGHPAGMAMPPAKVPEMPWAWLGSATMTAFSGPWGTTFAPNLTSDEETGIGAWDEGLFIATLRTGKIKGGGRPILPPMSWQGYSNMTDEDLKAVFAYLQTVPPVKNEVPDYSPPAGKGPGMGK